jgi:hypothetical protein
MYTASKKRVIRANHMIYVLLSYFLEAWDESILVNLLLTLKLLQLLQHKSENQRNRFPKLLKFGV